MGLSVISNVASAMSPKTSAAAPEASEGLPGEFAALLSGQTLAAMMALAGTEAAKGDTAQSNQQDASLESDKLKGDESSLPFDPAALVAMIGNSQQQPTIAAPSRLTDEPLNSSSDKNPLLGISSQLDEKNRNSPAATTQAAITLAESEVAAGDMATNAANIAASSETSGETINFNTSLTSALQQKGAASEHQVTVSTPLHAETWPKQFGEKIVWLAKQDQQTAQININPPQLGPVQITLNLSGDQATVAFASPHAEVRQAIESSMPQLKEMLAAAGISLGDSNVGANLAQQNSSNPFLTPNKNQSGSENAILPANDNAPNAGITQVLHKGRGLVDLFA